MIIKDKMITAIQRQNTLLPNFVTIAVRISNFVSLHNGSIRVQLFSFVWYIQTGKSIHLFCLEHNVRFTCVSAAAAWVKFQSQQTAINVTTTFVGLQGYIMFVVVWIVGPVLSDE